MYQIIKKLRSTRIRDIKMKKFIFISIIALGGISFVGFSNLNAKETEMESAARDPYVEVRANCKGHGGSLCSCSVFKGYKVAGSDRYYGSCQNRVNGHICGHSAAAHGLKQKR